MPHYEKPVFLRLQPEIAVTGTFKQRKVEFVKDGFDPSALPNPVYWLNPANQTYEKLTPAIYAEIGRTLAIQVTTGGATDAAQANRSGKANVVESFGLAGMGYHARDEFIDANSNVPRL